jgi:hypothetical protein
MTEDQYEGNANRASEGGSNPYDAPRSPDAAPEPTATATTKPRRPGAPFGIGLTLIICGSLASLFGVFGGLFTMATSSMMSKMAAFGAGAGDPAARQMIEAAIADAGSIYVVSGALQVVMGFISVLALVAGIGLVKYRLWGRKLSLTWAAVALGYIVVSVVVNLAYIMPATDKMMQAMLSASQASGQPNLLSSGMMSSIGGLSSIFGSLLLAILPVLTLILISKDKIKNSLS